jgi:hypothetical protein
MNFALEAGSSHRPLYLSGKSRVNIVRFTRTLGGRVDKILTAALRWDNWQNYQWIETTLSDSVRRIDGSGT